MAERMKWLQGVKIWSVAACATMLHLLGIDHKRLTYFHNGRRYRLTDVAGDVIHKILV
jgi:hypothetical protein